MFESLGVPYPVAGGPVTSAAFSPTFAGEYRWVASYSGDANNNSVSGVCNAADELTVVLRAAPAITTEASVGILVGSGSVADLATVSARVNPQEGATVDFRLYGPNDTMCSGTPVFTSLGVPYPAAGGPVTSATFAPVLVGDYRWVASYSGDVNNSAVSGTCNDTSEIVSVSSALSAPPSSQGGILPATGSRTGALLVAAFAVTFFGCVLVASTLKRRSLLFVRRR